MTSAGFITQGTEQRLLMHKEHAVEMIESIIKEMDLDPCAEQLTKDVEASGRHAKTGQTHLTWLI